MSGIVAEVEKGLIGRAAPYLKRAVLTSEERAAKVIESAGSGVGKRVLGVAGAAAGKLGSLAMWGVEEGGSRALGLASKAAFGFAGLDVAKEFLSRAVFGNDAVNDQETADGSRSGYVKGGMIAGAALLGMWGGRRLAAGGVRTAAKGIAESLRNPESKLSKAVSVGRTVGLDALERQNQFTRGVGSAVGAGIKSTTAAIAEKNPGLVSGLGAVDRKLGAAFGAVENRAASVLETGARAMGSEEAKPGFIGRRLSGMAGVLRSGGTEGLAERQAVYEARRGAPSVVNVGRGFAAKGEPAVSGAVEPVEPPVAARAVEPSARPAAPGIPSVSSSFVHADGAASLSSLRSSVGVSPGIEDVARPLVRDPLAMSFSQSHAFEMTPAQVLKQAGTLRGGEIRSGEAAAEDAVRVGRGAAPSPAVEGPAAESASAEPRMTASGIARKVAFASIGTGLTVGAERVMFGVRPSSEAGHGEGPAPLSSSPAGRQASFAAGALGGRVDSVIEGSSVAASSASEVSPRGATLDSSGVMAPSTAMQMAAIDRRMQMAAAAMKMSDVGDPKAHAGYGVSEGTSPEGNSFFRMVRLDHDHSGGNREFSIVVGADGRGGMAQSQLVRSDSNAFLTQTVVANEPGVVSGRQNRLSGKLEPQFGPKAEPIANAIGDLSRRPNELMTDLAQGAGSSHMVSGHLVQTTGPQSSQVMDFSVTRGAGKGAEVERGRVELADGYGRMVMLGQDGRTELWSKQIQGDGVAMDNTGSATLNLSALRQLRQFVSDPAAAARQSGPAMDPARDLRPAPGVSSDPPSKASSPGVQIAPAGIPEGVAIASGMSRAPVVSSDLSASPQAASVGADPAVESARGPSASREAGVRAARSPAVATPLPNVDSSPSGLDVLPVASALGSRAALSSDGAVVGGVAAESREAVLVSSRASRMTVTNLMVDAQFDRAAARGGDALVSRQSADGVVVAGGKGLVQKDVVMATDGSRLERQRFDGSNAAGGNLSAASAIRVDAERGRVTMTGFAASTENGVKVTRQADSEWHDLPGALAGAEAGTRRFGEKALFGTGDGLSAALGSGRLSSASMDVRETFRGGPLAPDGGRENSRELKFAGLDQDSHRVSGAVTENRQGNTLTLFAPDGKTPEFTARFDRSSSSKQQMDRALRDFLHDPKGFEQDHQAQMRIGEPNSAVAVAAGASSPESAGMIKAASVFKAQPALVNWRDMGEEKFAPARGASPGPIASRVAAMQGRDAGVGMG